MCCRVELISVTHATFFRAGCLRSMLRLFFMVLPGRQAQANGVMLSTLWTMDTYSVYHQRYARAACHIFNLHRSFRTPPLHAVMQVLSQPAMLWHAGSTPAQAMTWGASHATSYSSESQNLGMYMRCTRASGAHADLILLAACHPLCASPEQCLWRSQEARENLLQMWKTARDGLVCT